ncbi:hypothetical protein IFR05_010169 [Cadophora sp. M221]|nr:hypothetical protein IFR05_010169 [Cadophora sp. M221]
MLATVILLASALVAAEPAGVKMPGTHQPKHTVGLASTVLPHAELPTSNALLQMMHFTATIRLSRRPAVQTGPEIPAQTAISVQATPVEILGVVQMAWISSYKHSYTVTDSYTTTSCSTSSHYTTPPVVYTSYEATILSNATASKTTTAAGVQFTGGAGQVVLGSLKGLVFAAGALLAL